MALGPTSSPVSLDFTTGIVGIYSNSDADVGVYSWVISVTYETVAGGILATSSLTLDVEIVIELTPA